MTLPAQGNPIGIKDINVELGLAPEYSSSLSFLNGYLATPAASPNMAAFFGKTYYALVTGNCNNSNCSASPNNCQYQCTNCSQCNNINCTSTGSTLLQDNCNCAGPTFNCDLITNQLYNCACDCACACDCNCNCNCDCNCNCACVCDCNCACDPIKIICNALYDKGLLPKDIWAADQLFGRYLRKNDRRAYRGYIRWARVITAWIDARGPKAFFWIKNDAERNKLQSEIALKLSAVVATPWAEHMAFLMGAKKEDNITGRLIMNMGKPICRFVDHIPRVSTKYRHTIPVLYLIVLTGLTVYGLAVVGSKFIQIKEKIKYSLARLKNRSLIK